MRQRFFMLCAIVSLLLSVASLVFGLWGFRESSDVRLEWIGVHRTACLLSDRGSIALVVSWGWPDARWAIDGSSQTVGTPTPLTINSLIVADTTLEQINVTDGAATGTVTFRGVRTNILYATLFTLLAPAAWLVRWMRRRPQVGLCATCGYDLRATPERCPECGAACSATVGTSGPLTRRSPG